MLNDDGPPSPQSCPYLLPFVEALQNAGHLVSVVIPDSSRSWIGKAHLIGVQVKATYVSPSLFQTHGSGEHDTQNDDAHDGKNDWVVVSGTPACCTQLGLYSLFPDREPIDLVVSGPNHGRNATTIYSLASGTVGGAMEAVTCGKKAIAVSFASKEDQPAEVIQAASRLSARLIEHLYTHWPESVELFNINVPMYPDVEHRPIVYSTTLQGYWSKGSLYGEVDVAIDQNNNHADQAPTESGGEGKRTRYFQWAPELSDIQRMVDASEPGTDAFTISQGCTSDANSHSPTPQWGDDSQTNSVTPLTANYNHVPGFSGELQI
ncbi:5'/3'-nucleotidase SurE [Polytolypa hystricis UAMH7299]|uniref:5'/3'-nucleotidase SurE n=1 Tax=Polytolypa hystricis (strain UAMH7299) TaxID=1447883 RepID=A0A2B7XEV1_POLH7|nr:5'/3'-nucleotidase SurE [Polytolypa hystricis UAMH7299]